MNTTVLYGNSTGPLRQGLKVVYPQCLALQFLPKPVTAEIPEDQGANDLIAERYETVENVAVYTMAEYSDIFKCENAINSEEVSYQTVQSFMDFFSMNESHCDIICAKSVYQGNSHFWFNQCAVRITASNFYKVCRMKETTHKTNTVKLMNYCPIEHIPEQLEWGHQELSVAESGLVIYQRGPFLGARPGRIPSWKLVECKSLFSKRNLLPGTAASEKLIKTTRGFQVREETSWYYQIQGQMAITGIHHTDLLLK